MQLFSPAKRTTVPRIVPHVIGGPLLECWVATDSGTIKEGEKGGSCGFKGSAGLWIRMAGGTGWIATQPQPDLQQ